MAVVTEIKTFFHYGPVICFLLTHFLADPEDGEHKQPEENIDVENIELNQNRNLSTIDAFKLISSKYKNVESYYIMGADNFKKLPKWKDSQELIENYKYIVFERKDDTHKDMELEQYIKNNEVLNNNKNNFHILTLQKFDEINSGIIRNYIKQEEYSKCNEYTKPEVIEYIKNNKLYKN